MIKVKVSEPSQEDPLKYVCFHDSKGKLIRESYYDQDNNLILDDMNEFSESKGTSQFVLFIGNNYEAIAYRDVFHTDANQRLDKRSGCTDYKSINGEFKKISWMIYKPSSKEKPFSKGLYYNQNDEMLYYCINDDTTFTTTYFTPDDKLIADFYDFHQKYIAPVETYDSIKSDLLQKARNKYNNPQ